jgi:hypothetical protein
MTESYETHLRELVKILRDPKPFTFLSELSEALRRAGAFISQEDRCEYHWENGCRCPDTKVRKVRNMFCCEEHARIRDDWYRGLPE